jgi:beta-lysine 5,6-aminomutase beta subunit
VIRPYGDSTGDGMVQVSFTLPIPHDERAEGAARQLANKMGIQPAMVVHAKAIGTGFTFFVVYGPVSHLVDLAAVEVVEREYPMLSKKETDLAIRAALGRRLVVVGACIGTDAHTVGIDAILNVKGFAGEKGLESYREIKVVNLGAQVDAADLVSRAAAEAADAILVSQVVTQRDAHRQHVREVTEALASGWPADRPRPVLVVGGPRFEPGDAAALDVDRIFGKGTTPGDVASYLVHAVGARVAS